LKDFKEIKIFCELIQNTIEVYAYELEKLKEETARQVENHLVNNQSNLTDYQKNIFRSGKWSDENDSNDRKK
jgi:hypothetical protein